MSGGGFERESGVKLRNFTMEELIEAVCFIYDMVLSRFTQLITFFFFTISVRYKTNK